MKYMDVRTSIGGTAYSNGARSMEVCPHVREVLTCACGQIAYRHCGVATHCHSFVQPARKQQHTLVSPALKLNFWSRLTPLKTIHAEAGPTVSVPRDNFQHRRSLPLLQFLETSNNTVIVNFNIYIIFPKKWQTYGSSLLAPLAVHCPFQNDKSVTIFLPAVQHGGY
jgi:hypothetical protein